MSDRRCKGTLAERFWSFVHKTDGCWIWTGTISTKGYGFLSQGHSRTLIASRVSWELNVGPIPPGKCVLHHCDNRCCVRPSHLFLGTRADNTRDMVSKKRHLFGERNPRAILTVRKVLSIRKRRAKGHSYAAIAHALNVERYLVAQVATGKTWNHV